MSLDPTSERPRESWTERNERDSSPPSYKRDLPQDDRPPRRTHPPLPTHLKPKLIYT